MARGKVKYRDVVGKGQVKNKKNQKNKPKPRKTYSLYQNSKNKIPKRKYNDNLHEAIVKKQKIEELHNIESSSESEAELEDDMTKLLNTFGDSKTLNNKASLAIDSSESEIEEEEEGGGGDNSVKDDSLSEEESELSNSISDHGEDDKLLEIVEEEVSDREIHLGVDTVDSTNNEVYLEDCTDQTEIDLDIKNEADTDIETPEDPFVKHLSYELHESLLKSVQNAPLSVNQYVENWPHLGKICIQIPKCDKIDTAQNNEFSISENKTYAPQGEIPRKTNIKTITPVNLCIKSQIICNLAKVNKSVPTNSEDFFTPLQAELFSVLNNYQDLYYPERTFSNAEEIRYIYCLHAVNHIIKTRNKVIHHNAKLSKKDDVPEEFRDQGLIRPKVLIIVPFKDAACKIIHMIIDLILPGDKGTVMNKKRFIDDYTGNELILPKRNPKPEDYEQTFQGNTSDDFKMGMTVTKKSIKLYADFYSSDIIVASPLGLRRIIGAEGEEDRDYDFLASIELLVLDQTEIFLMQNWDHVIHFLNHMHLQPKDSHGTDFSRVRTWSLNGWAKYYRQTLIFSSFVVPEINSVFNKKCLNYAGKVKVVNNIQFGSISQVFVQLPHVFHRLDAVNAAESIDRRFDMFVNKILPQQKESLMKQTLIFIPNYFDYVRVRNYFKREDIGFVQVCEYSKEGKVARARDMFYHGDAHFLLYTERYHFFNRKQIKGIRHLVFYQPPNFSHFYYEMCNSMQEANMNKKVGNMSNMTVTVIYSKYDVHQLAALVGTERAAKMCQSERKVHMMVTGAD